MSKNKEYAEQYAGIAMEQMRRYGIPASVTLAQAILESSNGQSRLAQNENNHFGIKATSQWIEQGGEYGLYTDDRKDEKFCSYDSVADSYEHHSRFLAENSRYAACFELAPDDYKGWTEGIAAAGYASAGNYAANLQKIIEANGLQEYDRMVMAELGAERNESAGEQQSYSFPVERDEFMFVTVPFGMRADPNGSQIMHKGMDIRCDKDEVLATEDNGRVVAVSHDAGAPEGMSVTVEYEREDGSRIQSVYMQLSDIDVSVGDSVHAGQRLGVSGDTLHFGVAQITAGGTRRDIDPAVYLAEIADKGNIRVQALHDGNDLLAKYREGSAPDAQETKAMSPEEWMKKLLSSEDSGIGLASGSDPIVQMAVTAFTSLMALALAIDNKEEEEQYAAVSEMAGQRNVDLTPLLPNMKACSIAVNEAGKAVLEADNGSVRFSRELTAAELSRLSAVLNNPGLTEETKRMRIAGTVSSIVLSYQASANYEQGLAEQQGMNEQIRR